MLSTQQFKKDTFSALNNPQLRGNFKRAMSGLMQKRFAVFPDDQEFHQLSEIGRSTRANGLQKLPELLQQLESNCSRNGIQVFWAETVDQANQLVLEIGQRHNAKSVVKG